MTIANSLTGLAMLRHKLPMDDTLSMLTTLHSILVQGGHPSAADAACVALYGAVGMWVDNPSALTTLHAPCSAIVDRLIPKGVRVSSAAWLLHANEAMALLGPGVLLDPPMAERWRVLADANSVARPHSTQKMLQGAAEALVDAAQHLAALQEEGMHWSSVEINVRLLPGLKPIDIVLTGVDLPCKVAVVLTGSWDSFFNSPSVLKGATHFQRQLLTAHGYVVVPVDVKEFFAQGATNNSRAAWLLTLLTPMLAA